MPNSEPESESEKEGPVHEFILAFDFGLKWVGVAVGQTLTASARPLTTLRAKQGKLKKEDLNALIEEWRPNALVVGLPLNMDDSESDMSSRSRRFARFLEKTTGLPTHLVDERLTSYAADTASAATGPGNHAEAASIIAMSFLNEAT